MMDESPAKRDGAFYALLRRRAFELAGPAAFANLV
jgi:hypothetical protein